MSTFFAGPRTTKTREAPALLMVHVNPVAAIALATSVRNCRRVTAKVNHLRPDLSCPELFVLILTGLFPVVDESVRRVGVEGCVAGFSGGLAGMSDLAKRGNSVSRMAS